MPAEHFGLFLLRIPDGVHAEFAENQRPFLRQILQPQQVTFEVPLIVQVNVETAKIDVLREKIFGWRIRGVGKKRSGVNCPPHPNQFLDKFHHPARAKPAHHGAGNFVSNKISENRRVARISTHSCTHCFSNLTARFSLGQKLDMLRPWQCNEHTHAATCATIEKPSRWNMIDPHHVEALGSQIVGCFLPKPRGPAAIQDFDLGFQLRVRRRPPISFCVEFEHGEVSHPYPAEVRSRIARALKQFVLISIFLRQR